MNYGIKQSPLFPAFAVSMMLHSVAMVLWSSALQSVHLNSPAALNTLTVELTTLTSRHSGNGQNQLLVPEKPNLPTRLTSKKLAPNKSTASKQAQKSAAQAKQSSTFKKTKAIVRRLPKKQGIASNNLTNQGIETHKLTVSDRPDVLIAQSTAQSDSQTLTEAKTESSNDPATNNQQISPATQSAASKLTNKLPATSAALPPLLKSRQPEYPEEARWEERTGKVTVKFKISERGRIIEPSITDSSGHRDLDLAAIQAIRFWQFALKEGQTVNQWYYYSFRFELN